MPSRINSIKGVFFMAIVIDGKEYDDSKFSPELRNYITSRQELQVNKTRLNLELEKIEVLTEHFNKKIVDLLKEEADKQDQEEKKTK
tara:strand:- start:127 stop:387 length:261 start_codon:yes stop_codon:yes gene_type:complete